ncbi:N-formylglutamate amidohydrolase [Cereibacter sediminicola]|uniref:N-formylglutamate amidohydrolase n=1 Tax=Cereibacter sediminicola TaxID=2584941 RepID=UPI00119F092C|nr:N-formylglutamate amidohydrolase [Cereibacter sediminicola]
MTPDAYTLIRPERRDTSVIFSSPHSGRDYPASLVGRTILDERTLRSSEDAFVDELLAPAPLLGAPLLLARVPRAYVDMNRAADEMDPALIEGISRAPHNPRVSSGLGVIPRVVANGRSIYRGKMPLSEAEARIARYWTPYHRALRDLIEESRTLFDEAVLVDCHSMPHEAIETHARPGQPTPEVVLGDRFGAAASREVVDRIEEAFVSAGLRVVRNAPFAGAYIAQAYGRPSRNQHVVQVEVDRSLYMDEMRIERSARFAAFAELMATVVSEIAGVGRPAMPLAAE